MTKEQSVEKDVPLGDWFRRTPESLRMLAEETEALRSAEKVAPTTRYLARDPATLDRADLHGCLSENVETGDPTVCALCVTSPGQGD